ncbi:hypothetical protein [Bradyrhizobium canariense]|uniref:hypothetical protein n=1 Tax=Bradyrhizobium canariense TaxID=255045 RepID=UPI00142F996C|nr:hypothetical protein [Bradyrhizobium canariense]
MAEIFPASLAEIPRSISPSAYFSPISKSKIRPSIEENVRSEMQKIMSAQQSLACFVSAGWRYLRQNRHNKETTLWDGWMAKSP